MPIKTQPHPDQVLVTSNSWWCGGVIYQIYIRSFCDSNGDGIGDLPGITSKLEYVAELGVEAIWLTPFFKSPQKDMGYDVSDYREVDPLFGDQADFDELLVKAHLLGLKVIIDQVLSHTSDQHEWFQLSSSSRDNKKSDWYVWADPSEDGGQPNNWLSLFGGSAWAWCEARGQYYLHNFLESQPDLNFHNKQVQDELLDVVEFWCQKGVDGFRLDTVNFYFHDQQLRDNPPLSSSPLFQSVPEFNPYGLQEHLYDKNRPENLVFLERLRARLDQYSDLTTIGELGEDGDKCLQLIEEYTGSGTRLHMCYGFEMLSGNFTPEKFVSYNRALERNTPNGWLCHAFSNHDVTRHISLWDFAPEHHYAVGVLALNLLLSLRGSVCLYQGEELGIPEAKIDFDDMRDPYGIAFWPEMAGRDGCRTPMPWQAGADYAGFGSAKPWLPVDPCHLPLAVDQQNNDSTSMLAAYRRWLDFRKQVAALINGDTRLITNDSGLLVVSRAKKDQQVLVLFNLEASTREYLLPEIWRGCEVVGEQVQVRDHLANFGAYGFGYWVLNEDN